jgi:anti-sigma factor RsiW
MIDCSNAEIRDRLPELVNGHLDGELLDVVRAHLVDCDPCRAEVLLLERTRAVLLLSSPRIDTAAVVRALPAPGLRASRRAFDWRIAASIAVLVVGGGSAAVLYSGRSPARIDSVALAAGRAPAPTPIDTSIASPVDGSELSVSGDLSGLSDDELRTLLGKVEGIEALPAAEVHVAAPLNGVVAPEAAGTRDRSGAL